MNPGINLITPLIYDASDGPYKTTKTMIDAIRQNLKVLFLTNPGERIMDQFYGIGIKRYLFENETQELVQKIRENIFTQLSKYMPYVTVNKLLVSFIKSTINISFSFAVNGLSQASFFEIIAGK